MAEPKAPTPRYHIPRAHGDAHAAHTQAQATSAPLAHGGAAAASIAAAPSTLQEPKPAPILAVHEATARYGRRVALNRVSLHIDAGDILVLLGPNGAGKSTLVKSIAGRLKLQAGSVHVVGRNPRTDKRARQASGFVPQQLALFDKLTAIENLKAFGRLMGLKGRDIHERALQTLEYVGLADRAHEQVGALSGGMKRRINIGAALMHQPQLVVLDEPTVGVDMKARRAIAALLRRLSARGIAILLTTHDMEEAEALADQVAILVGGEIKAHGKRAHLIEDRFGAHQLVTLTLAGPREERLKSWLGVRFERALRDFGLR
ncbi:MAG: ABC transporter ATP-binding protein, partial [Pseudomonadota bacterium]